MLVVKQGVPQFHAAISSMTLPYTEQNMPRTTAGISGLVTARGWINRRGDFAQNGARRGQIGDGRDQRTIVEERQISTWSGCMNGIRYSLRRPSRIVLSIPPVPTAYFTVLPLRLKSCTLGRCWNEIQVGGKVDARV